MRSLNRCDFCDAEAAGAFEIVPPALEPTEAEQRRVVLCTACRDRIEDLLAPFLARLDGKDGAAAGSGPGEAAGESGVGSAKVGERSRSADSSDEDGDESADGDGSTDEDGSADEDGDDEDGNADEVDSDEDESATVAAAGDENGGNGEAPEGPPPGYGNVVRLLRNREFPMEREAVESLAAGAYELEREEIDAIISYAIDDGEVHEDGDQLVRP